MSLTINTALSVADAAESLEILWHAIVKASADLRCHPRHTSIEVDYSALRDAG